MLDGIKQVANSTDMNSMQSIGLLETVSTYNSKTSAKAETKLERKMHWTICKL